MWATRGGERGEKERQELTARDGLGEAGRRTAGVVWDRLALHRNSTGATGNSGSVVLE